MSSYEADLLAGDIEARTVRWQFMTPFGPANVRWIKPSVETRFDRLDLSLNVEQAKAIQEAVERSILGVVEAERCPLCGHAPHDFRPCGGMSSCDCGMTHRCACSYPDPENYSVLP